MPAPKDPKVLPFKAGIDPALADVLDIRDSMGLRLNDKRKPIGCLENVVKIMLSTGDWQGVLAYNQFSLSLEKNRLPPYPQPSAGEWQDDDDDELDLWLSKEYDIRAGKDVCGRAAGLVGRRNSYHPVREWLDTLVWDGQARLDTWLLTYLGAIVPEGDIRSPDYYAKAGAWWLISAIARIYRPGCQADHVLLLEGQQGKRKSMMLEILGGQWFGDQELDFSNKDSMMALQGKLKTLKEGTQKAAKRVRYFDPTHQATATAKNKAGKGVTWGMGRAAEKNKALREAGFGPPKGKVLKMVGGAIITDKTKVTIAKTPLSRFHVERVTKHFSATDETGHMVPLMSTGSVIEKAYL